MSAENFIKEIAPLVQKYAPKYDIKVCSPIIAQGILESARGTSELAVNANNYFGLKYRPNRCPSAIGIYYKIGSEQNADGTYVSSAMQWMKFANMEDCVKGYFDFTNISTYSNLKGVTDPYEYLKRIKADGYATSIDYVKNLMNVINNYNLTQYDTINNETQGSVNMSYVLKTNLADKSNYGSKRALSQIKFIVWHYTANDGDSDENNGKYFSGANRNASAHYFVDDDSITISVPDDYIAWSVGGKKYSNAHITGGGTLHGICTNSNSISIELCDNIKDGKIEASEKTLSNAIELTRDLMKKYNIDISHVVRHFDVTGKICPAYFVDNEKWANMKDRISGKITSTTSSRSYLMIGDEGNEVKQLQENLNYIGYNCGVVDGDFGSKTDSALRKFQSDYNLEVDGKYGKNSKKILEEIVANKKNLNSYTKEQFIKDVQKAIGAKVDGIAGQETLSKTVTVSKSKNRKHAVVKPLQKYLNALSYNCGTADGIAGNKFDSATKAWQKANGCIADGEFTKGANSWKRILGLK